VEFPKDPTRRQVERQRQVAITISGMQDICLEVGFIPVEVTQEMVDQDQLPSEDPGFNWQTFQTYLR